MFRRVKEEFRNCRDVITRIISLSFLLLPINKRKIIFDNFSGRGYGDNPKYVTEEIIRQGLKWDIVWLTYEIDKRFPESVRTVKYGSLKAMYELATAHVWVDNVRGSIRPKKRKNQVYLQTWHSPGGVKKLEAEVEEKLSKKYVKSAKLDGQICDAILASSKSQMEKMQNNFWLTQKTEVLKFGSPRNDVLFNGYYLDTMNKKVRKTYGIPLEVGIILYMPTFRDNKSLDGYKINLENILTSFEKRYQSKFVILVRMHPSVPTQSHFLDYNERIINATYYPDAQELYPAADILISDYSSAPFDFTLLHKPVFLCTLDRNDYSPRLSSIFNRLPFSVSESNEELMKAIVNFDEETYWKMCNKFMEEEWVSYDKGDATRKLVTWIKGKMVE